MQTQIRLLLKKQSDQGVVKTLAMLDSNTEKELRLRVLNVLFLLNDFSETMPLRYGVQLPNSP